MTATVQTSMTPTVLVVDDEPDIRDVARTILEIGGFNVVDEADNGTEALERYQELDPPPVPTVVLLDNRMPGLTGLQVAEVMLAHHPDQLIVLFSAYLDDQVRETARGIGVAACVSKLDVARLPDLLRDLLSAG